MLGGLGYWTLSCIYLLLRLVHWIFGFSPWYGLITLVDFIWLIPDQDTHPSSSQGYRQIIQPTEFTENRLYKYTAARISALTGEVRGGKTQTKQNQLGETDQDETTRGPCPAILIKRQPERTISKRLYTYIIVWPRYRAAQTSSFSLGLGIESSSTEQAAIDQSVSSPTSPFFIRAVSFIEQQSDPQPDPPYSPTPARHRAKASTH